MVDTQGDVSPPSDPSQATTDPEPVDTSYDGTNDGIGEAIINLGNTLFTMIEESVTAYWEGWWPVCHIIADRQESIDCQFMVHVSLDLLGSFSLIDSSSNWFGMESMSDTEKSLAQDQTIDVVDFIWSEYFNWVTLAVVVTSIALAVTTVIMGMTGIWQPWFVSLCAWSASMLVLIVSIFNAFISNGITGTDAGWKYLFLILSLVSIVAGSLGQLWMIGGLTWSKMTAYWRHANYLKESSKIGRKGRAAVGNLLVSFLMLALATCCAWLLVIHG